MSATVRSGSFVYEVVMDWAKLLAGWELNEVDDVAVDSQGRVYVCCRGTHPVIVFDTQGNVLDSWGDGILVGVHGITVGPGDALYCVDRGDHTVKKCTPDGEVLMVLGTSGEPAPFQSGRPFNLPAKVALDPKTGDIYVADGYSNSRVHKYSPDGEHLFSWGQPGSDPSEFNLVHTVRTDSTGKVYVADRENHRVQIFDSTGKYLAQWNNLHRPCALLIDEGQGVCFVGEIRSDRPVNREYPSLGPRITILNLEGRRLARLGGAKWGEGFSEFLAPHGLAMDSRKDDIYVAELSWIAIGSMLTPPRRLHCLRKLVKV